MNTEYEEDRNVLQLEGWTKEEKVYLLQGLKAFGSYDIEHLQEYLTSKSPEEISTAIAYYKRRAQEHPIFNRKQNENAKESTPRVPLASWAKLLTDCLTFAELGTETSTALRMIADLEDIPSSASTENIDFRIIYHELANALEGKSLMKDNYICAIINKCLVETAMSSKSFIRTSAFKFLITSVCLVDKEMNVFPRPTENHELAIVRHLASQRNYNPLNIHENYLRPTGDMKWEDSLEEVSEGDVDMNASPTK